MGVKVNRNKKQIAQFATMAIVAFSVSGFFSVASSSAAPTPAPRTNSEPTRAPKTTLATTRTSTLTSSTACAPTNAVAHNPMKVGTPDGGAVQVDRIFTLNTNCGQIVFKAFGRSAPLTVIAMTWLAKAGYLNHSLCHRVTTSGIYVLQCGDPTASGSGGPPFQYNDENLPADSANNYPAGTIAMANSGLDASGHGTNGSQFFIVYKDTTLPPSYSIWGVVTKGLDIVKKVAAAGVIGGGSDGKPSTTIAIESVTVK